MVKNPGVKVDWSNVSDHGMQRLEQRGVSEAEVNSWVKNGKALEQNGGSKWLYVTKQGAAVVAKDGTLVTVIPAANYDANMWSTVTRLFGSK
ncbi:hypothetical protein BM613_07320 [Sulfoacidibacillus thermotolerans]|uniref:DUF4258 domain-containing protein n=1 Tax=Sulfoacidibacillus thermotolerans TaxID=1765684 RepID=A0A2U3D948_SULT2|nr:hypothetical protein BM613_07320 [Sulfoacidibacillus thermotolerans]